MSRAIFPGGLACLSLLTVLVGGCGPAVVVEAASDSDGSDTAGESESGAGDGDGEASASESDTDSATGDGDGDTSGDGDGDLSGDGDGDGDTSGDGDGEPSGDGDGDESSGDGDGDESSGDGDGDEPCPLGTEGCPCDVGAICAGELECNLDEGLCLPAICELLDPEPHQDEPSARVLQGVDCGASLNLGEIATIEGPQTDWFRYPGNAQSLCDERPRAMVAADAPLEVCVYIECTSGNAVNTLDCGAASEASSPAGRPGCCGQDSVLMDAYNCQGPNNDVNVFLSVGSDEELCMNYVLSYGL